MLYSIPELKRIQDVPHRNDYDHWSVSGGFVTSLIADSMRVLSIHQVGFPEQTGLELFLTPYII